MGDPIVGVRTPAPFEISAFNGHGYSEAIRGAVEPISRPTVGSQPAHGYFVIERIIAKPLTNGDYSSNLGLSTGVCLVRCRVVGQVRNGRLGTNPHSSLGLSKFEQPGRIRPF